MDDETMSPGRRELLRQAALLIAGVSFACAKEREPTTAAKSADAAAPPATTTSSGPEHAFLPPQRATFEAACARILPSDQDPGAKEANVIEYIDRELARPELAKIKRAMLAGIVALDTYARRLGGKSFRELGTVEQDDIIHQVQRASDRGRDFVKFMILLTLEGFVSDPMYGGNKDGVGWKFIGYGPGNPDGSGTGGHGNHGGH